MTTPCLRLFKAELTKAFLLCFDRFTRRSVEATHNPIAIRKEQTTRPPSTTSETTSGSAALQYLPRLDPTPDAATAQMDAIRHTTTPAGIMIPPPVCHFLSAIGHPRI